MADLHSSIQSIPSQHSHATQFLQRQEKSLLAKLNWDQGWDEKSIETGYSFDLGRKPYESREWNTSEKSSSASEYSSVPSSTRSRISLGVLPVHHTLPFSKLKAMSSDSSLQNYIVPPGAPTETPNSLDGMSLAEAQRPPSPRSQMSDFRAENRNVLRNVYSSPLERFLAQEDELSGISKDPQLLEEEWRRLRALRANVFRLRAQLRAKRKELYKTQLAKSSADEAFIKYVREHRSESFLLPLADTQSSTDPMLDTHYEAMQKARDDYGPEEDDCNNLEDFLDQQEFEMAKLEGRLYGTRILDVPLSEPSLPAFSPDVPDEYHPLHISYLSRLGDLDLARERYYSMNEERDHLLFVQESRSRLSLELEEVEQNFLTQFPAREAALLGEIAEIEEDVEQWKAKCLADGIEIGGSDTEDTADMEYEVTMPQSSTDQISVAPGK